MYRFIATILFGCVLYPSILSARLATEVVEKQTFVMILNSYSYEEEWSTALAKEICNRLQASGQDIKMNITYAGIAARTSFLADRFAMQGAFANGRLNNQIKFPDVLVLIGDEDALPYHESPWNMGEDSGSTLWCTCRSAEGLPAIFSG